jgi:hypothetical protein
MNQEQPQPNNLTGKDVIDFGKEVGKDTAKQALVWTFASMATKGLRSVIDMMTKGKSK